MTLIQNLVIQDQDQEQDQEQDPEQVQGRNSSRSTLAMIKQNMLMMNHSHGVAKIKSKNAV